MMDSSHRITFDSVSDELLAVADSALSHGRSVAPDAEVEVFVYFSKSMEVEIDQGIVTAKDGAVAGAAARVALGKRIGFASASGVSDDRVKSCVDNALEVAKSVNVEDPRFEGFCDPAGQGRDGAFDDRILELGTDDLIRWAQEVIEEAKKVDERVKIVSSSGEAWWGGYAVANTRGVLGATRFGGNVITSNIQAIEGEERRGSFEFDAARDRLVEREGLGARAAERAVSLLGAKKLDYTGEMKTVWAPIPASTYIASSLSRSVLGKPVVEGISPLCDRLGDKIAPDFLTIVDDGQSPKSMGTYAIDAEGHPQRDNVVIKDGVLKGFLFNSYYARAFDVDPTGNAVRGGGLFGSAIPYEVGVEVGTKHMDVAPGRRPLEDIVSSIGGRAVLIHDFPLGIFHTDVATGEFSIVANSVFLIEDGEIKHSIQPVSVAGNFYKGLTDLVEAGSDVRSLPWNVTVGTLVFDGFSVVG